MKVSKNFWAICKTKLSKCFWAVCEIKQNTLDSMESDFPQKQENARNGYINCFL